MGNRLREQVQRALKLLPLPRFAEGTPKAYRTIQSYYYGQREPTPESAREIAAYLRTRADEFRDVADALEAAADAEGEL